MGGGNFSLIFSSDREPKTKFIFMNKILRNPTSF